MILTGTGATAVRRYVRYSSCSANATMIPIAHVRADAPHPVVVDRFELTHAKGDPTSISLRAGTKETFTGAFEACGRMPIRSGDAPVRSALLPAGTLQLDDPCADDTASEPSLVPAPATRQARAGRGFRSMLNNGELKRAALDSSTTLPKSVPAPHGQMGFTTPIGSFVNASAD